MPLPECDTPPYRITIRCDIMMHAGATELNPSKEVYFEGGKIRAGGAFGQPRARQSLNFAVGNDSRRGGESTSGR
jgi:hypothetical protein